ncbi:hypothetical protein [Amycolatopsis anabasis]|uniref:hypothetical protein n=1 Tax=Amycolatopsis anabasis TaxID=1840409 RepID=UPI00131B3CA2|nr:hypothetical protein [Amycolatopsis anabasis]
MNGPFTLTRPLLTASPHEPLAALTKATGYADPGFAELLTSADSSGTAAESGQLYRLAENQVLRDLPAAPLWSGHGHAVWAQRVRDVAATPTRGLELAGISLGS